jgi:hypothetical protein
MAEHLKMSIKSTRECFDTFKSGIYDPTLQVWAWYRFAIEHRLI